MKLIKEIKSKDGILHFRRWSIFQSKFFSIYIHGIYKEDNDLHLHNHPWNILTIILKGSYIEQLWNTEVKRGFLNIGFRNRYQYHKIKKLTSDKVFTLAFVFGKRNNKWGYSVNDNHIIHTVYRKEKNKSELYL